MIGAVKGIIADKTTPNILIETVSGVFYSVLVSEHSLNNLPDTGGSILLYTALVVREQELYLVGFPTQGEKNLFEILITAKGIGPKQAIKILGECSGAELRSAIISGDATGLTRIKGISSKKAEQLILDLREKMQKTIDQSTASEPLSSDPSLRIKTELLLTMRALGYTDLEIKKSLDNFCESQDLSKKTLEILVTEFLSALKS